MGAVFELEAEQIGGVAEVFGVVFEDVFLVGGVALVPVVALEVVLDGVEAQGVGPEGPGRDDAPAGAGVWQLFMI